MSTPNPGRRRAGLALAAVLCLAACTDRASSAGETVATPAATAAPSTAAPTTAAPTTAAAPTTTVEVTTTDDEREPIVLKGAWSFQHPRIELPSGAVTESVALDGDVVGQGASLTSPTATGLEGGWVFHLRSPNQGEGVVAVQDWVWADDTGAGKVVGLSGAFDGMTGTLRSDLVDGAPGSLGGGTFVLELQRTARGPAPAGPTETRTIDYAATMVGGWSGAPAMGSGNTISGDVLGEGGWTGILNEGTVYSINAGSLDGEGEGVFVTVERVQSNAAPYPMKAELFGLSGVFAGFRGEGTGLVATGPDAPTPAPTPYTFEVSR